MRISQEITFQQLKNMVWASAIDTLEIIEEYGKEEEFENFVEEFFEGSSVNLTTLNDLLWFDKEMLFETLGIWDLDEGEE